MSKAKTAVKSKGVIKKRFFIDDKEVFPSRIVTEEKSFMSGCYEETYDVVTDKDGNILNWNQIKEIATNEKKKK